MANLSPIDWGGPIQADQQGVEEARATTAQVGGATSQATRELGVDVSGLGQAAAQGILHSQALAATAAVKERQADTLQFIEGHPYVPKSLLQQRMAPDDYAQWDAAVGSNSQWKDKNIVPMYTVAGHLFDSEAKQARTDAGNLIGLPGWRGAWSSTEQAESSTVRERYVNRMAANQMVEDNSASDATSIDKVLDNAVTPADFDTAAKMAEGSTWLHPSVKKAYQERALAAKDAFPVQESIRAQDAGLMKQQLARLQGPDAAKYFPNSTPAKREVLEQTLQHQVKSSDAQAETNAGISWAQDTAQGLQLPGSAVIDRTAAQKQLGDLTGSPAKLRAAELELNRQMEEGDRAQESVEGRALIQGVANIASTGHMGSAVASVLSNPNGTKAAGAYHERLMLLERSTAKNDPQAQLEHAQAFIQARETLQHVRTTGMTFEQFLALPTPDKSSVLGAAVDPQQLKPLQTAFMAAQQTEKKNDEHPLSAEVGKEIRLIMKDAYGTDPNKVLTPEELSIHANIEKHVLDRRNMMEDTGGKAQDTDYAKWINEEVAKPASMHVLAPWTWDRPWKTETPAEQESRPSKTINGETRHWDGKAWVQ